MHITIWLIRYDLPAQIMITHRMNMFIHRTPQLLTEGKYKKIKGERKVIIRCEPTAGSVKTLSAELGIDVRITNT